MKGLYAVPLGIPFLKTIVDTLIKETASNPLSLAHYLVILPTRRGSLMLQDAFIKATPTGCRILPRIIALADIEDGMEIHGHIPPEIFPPAMPHWQRLGLMSQLVLAFEQQKESGCDNTTRSLSLAQELIRLVDELETTGLHLNELKSVVSADFAAHWQITLDFFTILTQQWPAILEQEGVIEPAARKRLILEQMATHWRPDYPVILAGTTGTRPSTQKLAKAILTFDQGSIILAGVDPFTIDNIPTSLPPTHPQYALNQFVQTLNTPLSWLNDGKETPSRSLFLSKAMEASPKENWFLSQEEGSQILSFLEAIETPSLLEEARQIALIMRYELEKPGQVIALVTPDVELSRRVSAALQRWDLEANLSSGLPFSQSLTGRFLGLSSLLVQGISPTDLLSILKHPLYAIGRDRLEHLRQTREFEIKCLRTKAPHQVYNLPFPGHDICAPLLALNDGQLHPLKDFLGAHKRVAESLVGDSPEGGLSLLWDSEEGQIGLSFFETILEHSDNYPLLTGANYPSFLRTLMAQEVVRCSEGIGSRLLILGTLEARLLDADVIILGGLNEGIWPSASDEDPWLSRSMRESFGLPPLERKVGLSAHDFCTGMTAPKVYITRSLKRDGAPTLASRWWQRINALLATSDRCLNAEQTSEKHPLEKQPWARWSSLLDQPTEHIQFMPPMPCPPLAARPRRLSVTDVEKLLQDPYSIYAKKILNLKPLDPLEADLSLSERGQAIHQALDAFIHSGTAPDSPQALETLKNIGRQAFGNLLTDPRSMAFWWPRFERLAGWFLTQLTQDFSSISQIKTEVEGTVEFSTSNGPITLSAKADRIDILTSNQTRIVDYKTGTPPSKRSVEQGYSPQLSLEGVILKAGGFAQIPPLEVQKFAYWKVTGGTPAGEIISFENPENLIQYAEQGVRRLFEAFLARENPFHACPDPLVQPLYHDYAHLERLKEWN